MKNILKISISLFTLFSLVYGSQVFAEEAKVASDNLSKEAVFASVAIHNIKFSQDNNVVNISFDLANGEGVSSGIKYGVKLIKETDKGQFVVDEKIYDETLSLTGNTTIKKEITYIAPVNLTGEYSLLITCKNENGFIFSMAYAGVVNLVSSVKGLEIIPETCNLTIEGDTSRRTYNLVQGVDISKDENLFLNCVFNNNSDQNIKATPKFETHYRTIYGEIVSQNEVNNEPLVLTSNEKKNFSILLPKAFDPQAYDVKISLVYSGGESNSVVAHYVLQGASATIQNLSLDKDYYEKGDEAKISLSWSPSADSFPYSRKGSASELPEVVLSVKMINKIGFNCITPIKRPLSQDSNTTKAEIDALILRKCVNPTVFLSIMDVDGNILDKQTFSIQTTTRPETEKNPVTTIITIALITVLAILFYLKKKGKIFSKKMGDISTGVTMLFLIIMFGLMPFARVDALATRIEIDDGSDSGGGGSYVDPDDTGTAPAGLNATVNLDKSVYSPGEVITVTTSIYYNSCTNAARDIVATGYISGASYTGPTKTLFDSLITGQESQVFDIATFTAPNTPGTYILNIKIEGYNPASYQAYDSSVGLSITNINFDDFKNYLQYYLESYYSADYNYPSVMSNLYDSDTIAEIQSAVYPISSISISYSDSYLDFVRNYDLPFVVQAPPTVELSVNGSRANPQTITSGDPVQVEWLAQNATGGCTCSTNTLVKLNDDDPLVVPSNYCGNSIGALGPTTASYSVYGVTQQTVFTVSCNND